MAANKDKLQSKIDAETAKMAADVGATPTEIAAAAEIRAQFRREQRLDTPAAIQEREATRREMLHQYSPQDDYGIDDSNDPATQQRLEQIRIDLGLNPKGNHKKGK